MSRLPEWLRKKYKFSYGEDVRKLLNQHKLNTICKEARCPNINECYRNSQATFLILGNICTRNCGFCNVTKGVPLPYDKNESERIAAVVNRLNLKHTVITSPTRDDLSDGGASAFADTVRSIKSKNKDITIEVLIPDFQGSSEDIEKVINEKPDIIGHNLETVPRLYHIRKRADYRLSLKILKKISAAQNGIKSKSGLMLGLGEKEEEVLQVFIDLLENGCKLLSIGQYLQPDKNNYPVKEYIHPDKFLWYKEKGLEFGFEYLESGPFVRSSYHADKYLSSVKL